MFPVEVHIQENDDLMATMAGMRQWLDHRRIEPSTFRYIFNSTGVMFRVDFGVEAEAAAFANEFDRRMIGETAEMTRLRCAILPSERRRSRRNFGTLPRNSTLKRTI